VILWLAATTNNIFRKMHHMVGGDFNCYGNKPLSQYAPAEVGGFFLVGHEND
jgi:hypothetical protein